MTTTWTNDGSRDERKHERNRDYPLGLSPTALSAAMAVLSTDYPSRAAIDLISPVTWGGALVLEARFEDGSRVYIGSTVNGNTYQGADEGIVVEQVQELSTDEPTAPNRGKASNGR
jgi:hypothetical protein